MLGRVKEDRVIEEEGRLRKSPKMLNEGQGVGGSEGGYREGSERGKGQKNDQGKTGMSFLREFSVR